MKLHLHAILLTAGLIWNSPLNAAATYTPGSGFTTTINPSGVWSYGYSSTLGGTLTLHTVSDVTAGEIAWRTPIGSNVPAAAYNPTSSMISLTTARYGAGEFTLHPGPAEYSILRFTAPVSDSYSVAGSFFGQDVLGTTTDVHMLDQGLSIFSSTVNGFGPSSAVQFNSTVNLPAGGYLDFVVGRGNNTYFYDSTGISLSITQVPEPSSALTICLSGLALLRRRRTAR